MEFKEFKKKFKSASRYLDRIKRERIRQKCLRLYASDIDFNKSGRAYIISMEELAELSQEISKVLRGKGNKLKLIEEIADVETCIEYIKDLNNITESDINKAKNVKDDRTLERINKTGKCW